MTGVNGRAARFCAYATVLAGGFVLGNVAAQDTDGPVKTAQSKDADWPTGAGANSAKCTDWTCANRPTTGGGFNGWSGYDSTNGSVVSDCRVGGGTIKTCVTSVPTDGCLPPGETMPKVKCTGSYITNPAAPPKTCYVEWDSCSG